MLELIFLFLILVSLISVVKAVGEIRKYTTRKQAHNKILEGFEKESPKTDDM